METAAAHRGQGLSVNIAAPLSKHAVLVQILRKGELATLSLPDLLAKNSVKYCVYVIIST